MRISDWSSVVCSSDLHIVADRVDRIAVLAEIDADRSRGRARIAEGPQPAAGRFQAGVVEAEAVDNRDVLGETDEIGRASGRARVCQYVSISVVAVSLKTIQQ